MRVDRGQLLLPLLPAWYLWWRSAYARRAAAADGAVREVAIDARSDAPHDVFGGPPIKLTRWARSWPAMGWTPEQIASRAGAHAARPLVADAERPDFGDAFWERRRIDLTVREVVELVFARAPSRLRIYLWGDLYPELLGDLPLPKQLGGRALDRGGSGVWIGQRGNVTSLHYDLYHGLLVQILGRKRVVLVAPADSPALSPRSPFGSRYAASALDADWAHTRRGPVRYETVLEPGDALYIPPFWWHEVESLDDSISVPVRYTAHWHEHLHPGFFPHAYQRYAKPLIDRLVHRFEPQDDEAGE